MERTSTRLGAIWEPLWCHFGVILALEEAPGGSWAIELFLLLSYTFMYPFWLHFGTPFWLQKAPQKHTQI